MRSAEYETMFRVEETHWWYAALHRLIFDTLDRELPDWPEKKILDAGCGTGAILKRLGNSEKNIGVDLAPEAIEFCRQRGLTNVQQADIHSLPFAADSFDAVICSSVLYHQWIGNVAGALRELHRVLRPNGLLLLNLPAFQFLHSPHDEAVMTAKRFRKREVHALLNQSGFVIGRSTYWTTLLFPLAIIARTLHGSKQGRDFQTAGFMNNLLTRVMSLEFQIRKRYSLPFGVAFFATATKQNGHREGFGSGS